MNIINRIRSIYFLRQVLKGKREIYQWHTWHQAAFRLYRKNKFFECERNLAAAVLRQERKKNPYQIQGWDEAKKEYEDYFKMDGAIQNLFALDKGYYVTMFRGESYYCVKPPFHYSSVGTNLKKPVVYNLKYGRDKQGNFKLGTNAIFNLDEEWHTAFRYSTPEEIEAYEAEKSRQKQLDKEIKINNI